MKSKVPTITILFLAAYCGIFTVCYAEMAEKTRPVSQRFSALSARAFEIVPNTGTDMGPAFRRMLETVIAAGEPVEINLESGTYRLGPGPTYHSAVAIEKASHLRIRGRGADTEILLTSPRHGGFFMADCEEVWLEDLVVDHDPLPYTQGGILLLNPSAGWFDFAVQQGYPSLDESWFSDAPKPYGQWGMIFDAREPRLKAGAADFIFMERWERLGRRVWRMYPVKEQRERLYDMRLGDRFVHLARHGKGGCFCFWRCSGGGVRNVTVYSSQSLAVGSIAGDRITVERMIVERRPDTERLLSTNSDGVHCQQNLRGPVIRDCRFESMADDGVNIYYAPNLITGVMSDTTLRVSRHGIIEAGNMIEFFDAEAGNVIARSAVREVSAAPDGEYRLTLENPVPGLRAGKDGPVVYNLSRCGADFEIVNNKFVNHRRHGMMIKAPRGLIENNTIEEIGALGIVVGNDPDWPEGVLPYDLTIRGNFIKAVGRSRWYGTDPRGAAIQVAARAREGRLAASREVQQITLSDNTVVNPPGAALYVGAAQDIKIEKLRVYYQQDAVIPRSTSAIILENATKVRLENIRIEAKVAGINAGVLIHPSVEKGVAGVIVEDVRLLGPPEMKSVIDLRDGGYSGDGGDIAQRWIESVFRIEGLHNVFRARRRK